MQQHSAVPLPYFYNATAAMYNQDGGGVTSHPQWLPEGNKPNQYPNHHWENNGGFHVGAGPNYGPGQVQVQGGGQTRVQVGPPQQSQQQNHPPPTSTPPNLHGDMSKQQGMQNQQAQMNYVQARPMTPNFTGFPRGGLQQPTRLPAHNARTQIPANYMSLSQVLTSTSTPAIVQAAYPSGAATLMYGNQRQGSPYPNQGAPFAILQQGPPYYNTGPPAQHYYSQVLNTPQTFQSMSSGGPSPSGGGQQQPLAVMRAPSLVPTATVPPPKQEHKKRTHAIKIVDPDTNEEVVLDESGGNNNNVTPSRSNDSSARETPQPNADVPLTNNALAADFAARVAARAMSSESGQPAPEPVQDNISSDSETHHKQLPVVPNSEKIVNTTLSTSSEEFVPRSQKQAQRSEPLVEETRTSFVPTVSAETNAPAVEISRPKEPFPVLKNQTHPSVHVVQSPLKVNSKKQKSGENERQQAPGIQSTVQMLPPQPVDSKDSFSNKKGPKSSQKEEEAVVPKEKRDKSKSGIKEQSPSNNPTIVADTPSSIEITSISLVKSSPLPPAFPKDTSRNSVTPPISTPEEPVRVQQQQNGETAVKETPVAVDSNKTAARQSKPKKAGKMRDLNRKGIEKEGSDMDAFMEMSSVTEDRPPTPASPAPPAAKSQTPPLVPETAASHSPVDKIKEDLEEKEDKLVAAKNEENAKVSALSNSKSEQTAPVVPSEKPTPPLITLRQSYKEGQWSPVNPEGKKKYERDFLMGLRAEPQCMQKPENLPDVVAVINTNNNMRTQSMNFQMRPQDGGVIHPPFLQRSSQNQRGPLPKSRSQQGMKGKSQGPKVIHVSLIDDVKLKTAENAWKPTRLVSDAEKSEQERQTEELYKNVRGILNKLTPQKFDTLMQKFMRLPINSEERLEGVTCLIFEKAVDEPSFSKAYAHMCKICSKLEVSKPSPNETGAEQKVNFRKILITRCQTAFEGSKEEQLEDTYLRDEIKNCTDPEQKKELQLAYEEKERQIRMKSVGNIRFIGELFKLGMLTPAIMHRCIEHLLNNTDEESLECLCKLLTTIGKDLEMGQQAKGPTSLAPYFQKMAELAQKKESSKVSSRVRFMLQDVIDLRSNKWVPRREDNNPKTIDQITKEAEKESYESSMALNQPPPRMNRQNERQDDRKRGNRGNNLQNEDGWNTVGSNRHYSSKFTQSFDASKIQNMVKPEMDLNSLSLGGSSQFRFSSAAAKVETKPFTSSNTFSALQSRDERKPPPQPSMGNRRITSTPSIEKERQRMIQGVEINNDGRSSRGSSAQRERPQPPSRDNSQPRHVPAERDNKEVSEMRPQDRVVDEKASQLAEEKLERQIITIFEEYLNKFTTVDDVRQEVEQVCLPDKVGYFVQKALEISLEKKAGMQKGIGDLLSSLMDYNLISPSIIVEQFGNIYEMADDFAIDVPKVWELQAQVIAPILAAEKVNFSHFKSACSSVLKTPATAKLLVPVLDILVSEKGAGFVRKVWDSSNVTLKDFIPSELNIDNFIKEKSLEYLSGEPPKYESCNNQVAMDQVQDKLLRLMQSKRPCDDIFETISTAVGDKVKDPLFIRALVLAICEACIAGSNTNNLDSTKFKQYGKLIQRFVDNVEERELACLSAVHLFVSRLEHPQGLIKNIFNLLLDENLISTESFLKWKEHDQEKLENKGVSLYALTSFFTALQEGESEDENS